MNDQQRDSLLFDVTIEGDAAKALLHSLSPDPENGECTAIRLQAGNGHEGYGIYVSDDEYPEEGSMFLAALTQPQAQQAAVVPVFWYRKRSDGGYDGPISDAAIEDVRRKSGAWTPLYEVAPPPPALPLSAWQPIETAPKDGSHILLFCQDSAVKIGGGYWFAKKNCWVHGGYMRRLSEPTHWQPLPATPITEPGAGGEGV